MDTVPKTEPDMQNPVSLKNDVVEKYIRTFEKDMDAFKKGGTPGLVPLKETHIPPPLAPEPEPEPEPVVPVSPVPPVRNIQDTEPVGEIHEDAVAERSYTPEPEPVVPVPAPRKPEIETPVETLPRKETSALPIPSTEPSPAFHRPEGSLPIKTYSDDFQDRVRNTHASTATVLAAELDRAEEKKPFVDTHEHRRNQRYVVFGVLLLIVGGVGLYVTYTSYLVNVAPVLLAPSIQTPIFVDTHTTVSGNGTDLMTTLAELSAKPIAPDTVELVALNASTSPQTDIVTQLELAAPGMLLRNIVVPGTMMGIVHTKDSQSPFFILSVASYSSTFSGMLSWEPTMQKDLAPLFPLYSSAINASSTATSTGAVAPITAISSQTEPVFRDETIQNHDVRVYLDAQGRSVLLYGYWDEKTLIIARDSEAFAEILMRLANAHS